MPRTSQWKQVKALFLLFQPALQFFALLLVVSLLSRCSPLAPSVEKGALSAAKNAAAIAQSNLIAAENEKIQSALIDDQVEAQIKELPSRTLRAISEQDLEAALNKYSDAAAIATEGDFAQATNIVYAQQNNRPIFLRLQKAEKDSLNHRENGRARLNLIQQVGEADRQSLRRRLEANSLEADLYLVYAQREEAQQNQRLPVRLRLGMVFSEHPAALLYVRRDGKAEGRRDAATEESLQAALRAANGLVIVLR